MTSPAAPIADISAATPAEIDTRLFALYVEHRYVASDLKWAKKNPSSFGADERIAKAEARLAEIKAEEALLQDEFYARGTWLRYYLVTNGNGHVHREMDCRTCYPTTEYAWLPQLSDCDEGAMVEQYGADACTICFPEAPAHPAFKKSLEERAAAAAAKAATECSGSRQYAPSHKTYGRYGTCSVCGETVSRTTNGNARTHRPMQVRLAEEAAKEAEKKAKAKAAAAKKAAKGKSPQERRYDALGLISAAFYGPAYKNYDVARETDWNAVKEAAEAALAAGRTTAWQSAISRIVKAADAQDDTWMVQLLINASHAA